MKNILLLSLIFLTLLSASAQKSATAKWGEIYDKDSDLIKIVGVDTNGFYVVRYRTKKTIRIQRYNNEMSLVFSKVLTIPEKDGSRLKYQNVYYLQGQLILLTSLRNTMLKESTAFASFISKDGALDSNFIKIDEISASKSKFRGFRFKLSSDNSKLLVFHDKIYDKHGKEKFSYKVYDNRMNLIWSKDVELAYNDAYLYKKDYILDNDGNVHLYAKKYPNKEKGEEPLGNKPPKVLLFSYNYKLDKLSELEIGLAEKHMRLISYNFKEDTKKVVFGGFYSDYKLDTDINGVFYLEVDLNKKVVEKVSTTPFDKAFLIDMIGESKERGYKILSLIIF
jgi:hypothetical protein